MTMAEARMSGSAEFQPSMSYTNVNDIVVPLPLFNGKNVILESWHFYIFSISDE